MSTMTGNFLEVYGPTLQSFVPEFNKLKKAITFSKEDMVGNKYHQPFWTSLEHGVAYAGANAGAFDLATAVAAEMVDAQVEPAQIVLCSSMDYETAFRAANGGKKAFVDATKGMVENMMKSVSKRLELDLLRGRMGLGKVSSNSSGTLSIYPATWSTALWGGLRNCVIEAFDSQSATANQYNGDLTITSVDPANMTVTVTGTNSAVVDGAYLYFKGARTTTAHKSMAGLDAIITNTGSLFNVDAATYSGWKGNTKSSVGTISMGAILSGVTLGVANGLEGDVEVYLNPRAWQVCNTDLSGLRRTDGSYSSAKGENGVENIVYHGQNGKVTLVSHPFVWEGDAYIIPTKKFKRIGSTDITFSRPNQPGEIFRELPTKAGYELRCYSGQSLFCEAPSECVKLTGITYPTGS